MGKLGNAWKFGKKVILPAAALGAGGVFAAGKVAEYNDKTNLQKNADENGIAAHTNPETGLPDYNRLLGDIAAMSPEERAKGVFAGPTANADAYGDFLRTINKPQLNHYAKPDSTPPPPSGAGAGSVAGPSIFKGSPYVPRSAGFVDPQKQQFLTPEELAALKSSVHVDASGMDDDLAKIRERYAGREQAKENQIKAIEDRPLNVDLSPVMDLWKSWYGTDFSSYKHPETNDERMARVYAMRDAADKEGAAREEAVYNMADKIAGRKMTADQVNQQGPIDAADRVGKARSDQFKGDMDVVGAVNQNRGNQAQLDLSGARDNESQRHNRVAEGIDAFQAKTQAEKYQADAAQKAAAGPKGLVDNFFTDAAKDATKKRLEMIKDPSARNDVLADAARRLKVLRIGSPNTPKEALADVALDGAVAAYGYNKKKVD